MKRIFITGSSDGLGLMAAQRLLEMGHDVLLHARNAKRGDRLMAKTPGALGVVTGDLMYIEETQALAEQVNAYGRFDAIIHNAAVGYQEAHEVTSYGLPHVFAINALAPYVLTCLIEKPDRLIYTSSGLHEQADTSLADMLWQKRRWSGFQAYADSKFYNVLLGFAVARHWPEVFSNVVTPGWVATKMGGPNAPDDLSLAPETQVWLAASDEESAKVTGGFYYHKQTKGYLKMADNTDLQDRFLKFCGWLTGIDLPKE